MAEPAGQDVDGLPTVWERVAALAQELDTARTSLAIVRSMVERGAPQDEVLAELAEVLDEATVTRAAVRRVIRQVSRMERQVDAGGGRPACSKWKRLRCLLSMNCLAR